MPNTPLIDTQKCKGCGLCVIVCCGHGRAVIEKVAVIIKPDACVWCTNCELVCPQGAASCPFEIICDEKHQA